MPAPPADLTAVSLTHTKASQLKFWIDGANRDAGGKKILTKQGKVQELRERIAEHYEIDLSRLPANPPPPGPSPVDVKIQQSQWDDLLTLGEEWMTSGDDFELCSSLDNGSSPLPPHLCESVAATISARSLSLARDVNPPSTSDRAAPIDDPPLETVQAWVQAAKDGSDGSLAALAQLQLSISPKLSSTARPSSLPPAVAAPPSGPVLQPPPASSQPLASFLPQSFPVMPPLLVLPLVPPIVLPSISVPLVNQPLVAFSDAATPPPPVPLPPAPVASHDAAVLAASELDVEALERVTNLREVIAQLENGDVHRFRERYGPPAGKRKRRGHPMWQRIKGTINRHERVFAQLRDEFRGDKDHFFDFFVTATQTSSRKRKAGDDDMVSYRLMSEAIPHCKKDIREEKTKMIYRDEAGEFSEERWREKWGSLNMWEVWRELGKERY